MIRDDGPKSADRLIVIPMTGLHPDGETEGYFWFHSKDFNMSVAFEKYQLEIMFPFMMEVLLCRITSLRMNLLHLLHILIAGT